MTELLYTQDQLIQVRNDNYNAGVETERERIMKLLEDNVGQKGLISVDFAKWLINGEGENK